MSSSGISIGDILGTDGKGKSSGLSDSAAKYFSLASDQVKVLSDADATSLAKWPIVPVGKPISLKALLPTPSTAIPTTGTTSGGSAITLPYTQPASVQWKIQYADFYPAKASDPSKPPPTTPIPFDTKTSLPDVLPSASVEDQAGCYQLIDGDLNSLNLQILPWPATEYYDAPKDPGEKLRALRIQLEVTAWFQGYGATRFTITENLLCVIAPWASVFSIAPVDPSDGVQEIFLPRDRQLPPPIGKPDPLAPLLNMFTSVLENPSPGVGEATTILFQPVDQLNSVPSEVVELVDEVPNVNIEAAIDAGAYIKGITAAVTDVFKLGDPTPEFTAAEVNVGNLLTSLLSVPIAVNVKGASKTKHMKPKGSGPLRSFAPLPDSPLSSGTIPFGDLNVPYQIDASRLMLDWNSNDSSARIVATNLKNGLGMKILPIPMLRRVGDYDKPKINLNISIPVDLQIPGRAYSYTIWLTQDTLSMFVPTIPVPQITLLTRALLPNIGTGDFRNEVVVASCPQTQAAFPNVTVAIGGLDKLHTLVLRFMQLFPTEKYPSYMTPDLSKLLTSILNTASFMLRILRNPDIKVTEVLSGTTDSTGAITTLLQGGNLSFFSYDQKQSFPYSERNISAIAWLGLPYGTHQYHLCVRLYYPSSTKLAQLYLPQPGTLVGGMIWDSESWPPPGAGYEGPPIPRVGSLKQVPTDADGDGQDEAMPADGGADNSLSKEAQTAAAPPPNPQPVTDPNSPWWDKKPDAIIWRPT